MAIADNIMFSLFYSYESIAVLINMFKFGYGFYVIRRNNTMPFVNGGISASIISEQPQ